MNDFELYDIMSDIEIFLRFHPEVILVMIFLLIAILILKKLLKKAGE